MNPATIQKLREERPEFNELIAFLSSEAAKLNTLDGLDKLTPDDRAIEATARLRAYETLCTILSPLIQTVDNPVGINPKEFVV